MPSDIPSITTPQTIPMIHNPPHLAPAPAPDRFPRPTTSPFQDGDLAPLADIVRLARQYRAQVFVDECHATGFVGPTGRGTDEYWGVRGQVDIINSTLGKALGGATGEGCWVACRGC